MCVNGPISFLSISEFIRKARRSEFFHQVAGTFANRILLILIGMAISVIVARILGPEGRGLFAVASTIAAVGVQFGNLGLHASNTYYVAQDRSQLSPLLGNSLVVSFGVGGTGAFLVWLLFHSWPQFAILQGHLLILALVFIPLGLMALLVQNLLLGIQEIWAFNFFDLINRIITVFVLFLLIFYRSIDVITVFLTGIVATTISIVWGLTKLKNYISHLPIPSFSLFKRNIGYGLKAYLSAFFAFLLIKSDLLIVQHILGAEQTGYYSIATSIADLVLMLPTVISSIIFPRLCSEPQLELKWKITKQTLLPFSLLNLVIMLGFWIFAKDIIQFLYGKAFLPATNAFLLLMPGIYFLGIEIIIVQFLNSIGFPRVIVWLWGLSVVLNIVLNLYFIKFYGINAASINSSICYFLVSLVVYMITLKKLNLAKINN